MENTNNLNMTDSTHPETETPSDQELFDKIDRAAIPVWRISGGLGSLFWFLVPVSARIWQQEFDIPDLLIYILGALIVINTIARATIIPKIKWRFWSYRISEHEIELRYGIFVRIRTLIPINRVQHVDSRQGPLMRNHGLATVTISTAATTHEIPALTEEVADSVRQKISVFARKAREDV